MSGEASPAGGAPESRPAVVVCGSLAIDVIGYYGGTLEGARERGVLSQSIQLDRLDVEFGGCAMNIAYSLALHGARALPVVRVGRDFEGSYAAHVRRMGIDDRGILVDPAFAASSHCIVLSDHAGNQLTAFYPGSTSVEASRERPHRDAGELARESGARIAVVAPDVAENMIRHARLLRDAGVAFVTDPGQGLPDFAPDAARALLAHSRWLILNAQEWQVLLRLLGRAEADVLGALEWVVVTEGGAGLRVLRGGEVTRLPAIAPDTVADHTGCGDALRAGLAYGLALGFDLLDALRVGTLTATYNIEARGCQRHLFTPEAFRARYLASWRRPFPRMPGSGPAAVLRGLEVP